MIRAFRPIMNGPHRLAPLEARDYAILAEVLNTRRCGLCFGPARIPDTGAFDPEGYCPAHVDAARQGYARRDARNARQIAAAIQTIPEKVILPAPAPLWPALRLAAIPVFAWLAFHLLTHPW